MTKLKIKELNDTEKMSKLKEYVLLNNKNRDTIDFDFEVDLIRIIKKLSIRKLMANDKKYMRKISDYLTSLYKKSYLLDSLKAGVRQHKRFDKLFTEKI